MDSTILSAHGLAFDYPTKRALFDIDLAIRRGGITALVGPNGAGKTTLIRCLVGLAPPTSGRIDFNGDDLWIAPRQAHRAMGYLPDFYGLYGELSVRACLEHGAEMRGIPRGQAKRRAEDAAARLDLTDRLDEKVAALSRGLTQRAAIARAIIHEPAFLVLDEPAAGLDPDARMRLSQLFRDLRSDGMTLLVSSHILAELEDYCTDMLIIRAGRIVDGKDAGAADRRRMMVELVEAHPDFRRLLTGVAGVSDLEVDGAAARFVLAGSDDDQAALLKHLIDAGMAVARFTDHAERLQDTYRRAVSENDEATS